MFPHKSYSHGFSAIQNSISSTNINQYQEENSLSKKWVQGSSTFNTTYQCLVEDYYVQQQKKIYNLFKKNLITMYVCMYMFLYVTNCIAMKHT